MHIFTEKLLRWHEEHPRPTPWKGERDPYKIWLSEIMLQQTRVEQGLPYFLKFVENYPTVEALAAAPEAEILKLWQGLGYYARARNLHATAKFVAGNLSGKFPTTYEGLRQLKGVGDYTAAAIASFAYDLPHAVVDGNVFRVLSRVFGIETAIDLPEGKRKFTLLGNELLADAAPAVFNQAIMDFGAVQCLPQNPTCSVCPMVAFCLAHQGNKVSLLPLKSKKMKKTRRYFLYFDFRAGENTFLQQRTERDIWQGLYEFPMLEVAALPEDLGAVERLVADFFFGGQQDFFSIENVSKPTRQLLTHREIVAVFYRISLKKQVENSFYSTFEAENYIKVPFIEIKKIYAIPKIIDSYLHDASLLLNL